MRRLFVRELKISGRVAEKILTKHGLHPDEVRATIEEQGGWPFRWTHDAQRGSRAIVRVKCGGSDCFVVLYPADGELGDVWHLGSAYPDGRDESSR